MTQGYRYHKLRKIFWMFFGSYSVVQIWWNIVSRICFWRNVSDDHLRWSSLQTKEVKCTANVVSSGSKIVKRIRRRKYYTVIIEWTIALVIAPLQPCINLSEIIAFWLTKLWDYMTGQDLSKPPNRRQDHHLLWLSVGTSLALGLELASRWVENSLLWRMSLHIFDILFSAL